MPTWLQCEECKEKFYTARSKYLIKDNEVCQHCEGNLYQIAPYVDSILEQRMKVKLKLSSEKSVYCKIGETGEKIVDLILEEKNEIQLPSVISADKDIEIKFRRKASPEGRYYFKTKIVEYYNQEKTLFKVKKPETISRFQERKFRRISMETEVEYQLIEDNLDKNKKRADKLKKGRTVDLSLNGVLIVTDKNFREEVKENQKVFLRFKEGDYQLSLTGKIARVAEIKEKEHNKPGLGIEFINLDEEKRELLSELQYKKMVTG